MHQFDEEAFCKLSAKEQEMAISAQEARIRLIRMRSLVQEYENIQKKMNSEGKEPIFTGLAPIVKPREEEDVQKNVSIKETEPDSIFKPEDDQEMRSDDVIYSSSDDEKEIEKEPVDTKRKREALEVKEEGEDEERKRQRRSPERQINYRDRDIRITVPDQHHRGYRRHDRSYQADLYRPGRK